jgi:hypothetical protein
MKPENLYSPKTTSHIFSRMDFCLFASGLLDAHIEDLAAAGESFLAKAEKRQSYFSAVGVWPE